MTVTRESTATIDGVLRNPELVPERAALGKWDGKILPYVPTPGRPFLGDLALHEECDLDIDPVTYQVLRWRLWNVNLEHDDTIRRVCGTVAVCYGLDYNTAILAENGDNVIGGPSFQRFVSQGDLSVKYTMENRAINPGIAPGDVFLSNDPYISCQHQLDVNVYAPVFWEGKLFCWVFDAAHQLDIGGVQQGSFCFQANDIFDEPVPWPPIKLVRGGTVQQDVLDAFMRQSRIPSAVLLNLRSQIAGLEAASSRMHALLIEHGAATVKGTMRRMIRDASRAVGERLLEIPDGAWEETFWLGGTPDRQVRPIRVGLRKTGDVLTVTNEGTMPQERTGNGTYSGFRSSVIASLQTMLAWDQMYCPAGVLDHLRFDPEPGTFTIAKFPAAVTLAYAPTISSAITGQVVSKMLLCGPEELRARAMATGGLANAGYCVSFGTDLSGAPRIGAGLECVIGALGASPGLDGVDTGGSWEWPRADAGNVEDLETHAPMMFLYRREQEDSGGPGQWRGGNGVEVAYVSHEAGDWHFMGLGNDPAVNNNLGLGGGLPGHSGNWLGSPDTEIRARLREGTLPGNRRTLEKAVGRFDRLSTCATEPMELGVNGVAIGEYCAGGGYGDPLLRDPEAVRRDVEGRAVTRDAARVDYGVQLDGESVIDVDGTEATRRDIRAGRLRDSAAPRTVDPRRSHVAPNSPRRALMGGLSVALVDGAGLWCCSTCDTYLGAADANYRDYCRVLDRRPQELNEIRYPDPQEFVDPGLVIRQWFCPGCGLLISTEFCRADDASRQDMWLDVTSIAW